jgi:SAM-dependent methyltransferase
MASPDPARAQQIKDTVRQDWAANAVGWRKWYPKLAHETRAATEVIVTAAAVRPGMQVLDLASGGGEPALTLAEAVGPGGHVTATDLVPEMLAIAEDNAHARGLTNISFQPADIEALPFPDQRFDAVTCRFGMMFVPDVARAQREVLRVLKPGARATYLVWGPQEQNPLFSAMLGAFLRRVQLPPPPPDAPNPFRFADPTPLLDGLRAAGFRAVQAEQRAIQCSWPGPPEEEVESRRELGAQMYRRLVEALPPEQLDETLAEALANVRQYYDGRQITYPALVVLVSGTR